jgi:hypothetical protein
MVLCGSRRDNVTEESMDSHIFSFSVAVDDALDIAEPGRWWSKPAILDG